MLKRIVLLLLFVQVSYGQDYFISKSDLLEICSDIQVVSNFQSQPVLASKNEQDVINKILSVLGVSKSPFILMPCAQWLVSEARRRQ